MTTISLRPLSREYGRGLFTKLWPDSALPPISTKFYEACLGTECVGWVATQYVSRRPGKRSHVIVHGLYVSPDYRGKNLQLQMREQAVRACRPKSNSTRKIQVLTYVSADNIASLRNVIKSGSMPYTSFTQGKTTYIKFEGFL